MWTQTESRIRKHQDQMLISPSLPADIRVSPLWSNVTLCTLLLCPTRLLTVQESVSISLTTPSLLDTPSNFPDWPNATWLAPWGPASTAAIGDADFLMSHRLTLPWESHEATRCVSKLNAAWLQGCWCPRRVAVATPCLASQRTRVLSAEQVRRRFEEGRKQMLLTAAVWQRSVSLQRWLFRSHSLAVLSAEQDAKKWPHEWKEQPQVGWVWPDRINTQQPWEKSQSRTCKRKKEDGVIKIEQLSPEVGFNYD